MVTDMAPLETVHVAQVISDGAHSYARSLGTSASPTRRASHKAVVPAAAINKVGASCRGPLTASPVVVATRARASLVDDIAFYPGCLAGCLANGEDHHQIVVTAMLLPSSKRVLRYTPIKSRAANVPSPKIQTMRNTVRMITRLGDGEPEPDLGARPKVSTQAVRYHLPPPQGSTRHKQCRSWRNKLSP